MNFQEHNNEECDAHQRVQLVSIQIALRPVNQLCHQARRIERRCRLKQDAQALAMRPECFDMVVEGFAFAAMSLVLR